MSERVEIGDAVLYRGDCHEVMHHVGTFDALVTDPPYGIGEAAGKNVSRAGLAKPTDYGNESWDDKTDQIGINLARHISKHEVIFGGNFYDLPPTPCWLVWDKENTGDFADCELAWTNLNKAVRRIYWMWNGMLRRGKDVRHHPTQKPLGVMQWCIEQLPSDVETILDPYAGSGTTGVAAIRMGKRFTGIEKSPKYFDIMCRRIEEACQQPSDLFIPAPSKPKQEVLI